MQIDSVQEIAKNVSDSYQAKMIYENNSINEQNIYVK